MGKIVKSFYHEKKLKQEEIHLLDFEVLIGAGGLLSHTKNKTQALSTIMEGYQANESRIEITFSF
jgi:hypothetical protein